MNAYQGSYLCDPANTNSMCTEPQKEGNVIESVLPSFNYQMDAISANSEIPLKAYTGYMKYQIEWIPSSAGYIRWILDDVAIFEIAAESLTSPPQDASNSNYHKLMIEEPMYIIFNVALSTSWGSKPPNPGKPCKGDGTDAKINKICDAFPMSMKVDYVRLYQDASSMSIGCDPPSHPTKRWIDEHLSEYQDSNNPVKAVIGQGSCRRDEDCSVGAFSAAFMTTGKCVKRRCQCLFPSSWVGPRCTTSLDLEAQSGPSITSSLVFGSIAAAVMLLAIYKILFTGKAIYYNREFSKAVSVGDYELVDLSQASDSADATIKGI
uniref:Betaglucan synthesisassociated protein putative n=1 Tax=Albugo laibachii Nc14 TaxID=890382 RepID=F0X2Q7_9STRA|nr:betaglucan synthesisassociated protein putative [Albugo laibachii Nc14]|eukprot:CCA28193.1 betaglucan synthesisassociated protein putative [Albugo laibachii Nc14]